MILKRMLKAFEKTDLKLGTKASLDFFQGRAKQIRRISRPEFFRPEEPGDPKPVLRVKPQVGQIYFYNYDPKWKKDLSYYDRWPLTLILEVKANGFFGMNFHYLPPGFRGDMYKKFIPTLSDKKFGAGARFNIEYQRVKRMRFGPPLFKEYLTTHLKSKLRLVQPYEWEAMLFLPLHQFKKASDIQVWGQSLKKLTHKKRKK